MQPRKENQEGVVLRTRMKGMGGRPIPHLAPWPPGPRTVGSIHTRDSVYFHGKEDFAYVVKGPDQWTLRYGFLQVGLI